MLKSRKIVWVGGVLAMLLACLGVAQIGIGGGFGGAAGGGGPGGRRGGGGGRGGLGGGGGGAVAGGSIVYTEGNPRIAVNQDTVKTARETASHSIDLPEWANKPGFEDDVFMFARIKFRSGVNVNGGGGGRRGGGFGGWIIDYPDADINISYRLHQLTTIRTDPDARTLWFTDSEIFHYPFIFAEHVERMLLSNDEVAALRKYLQAGGVLMINDTWGDPAQNNLETQLRRVMPGRGWVDLPMSHPIFHCIYDFGQGPLKMLQVPTISIWNYAYNPGDPNSGPVSSGLGREFDEMKVRAMLDDKGRIMVLAILNCDMPDGWEREGENETYFHLFSEKRSYPFFINIVYYLMTH